MGFGVRRVADQQLLQVDFGRVRVALVERLPGPLPKVVRRPGALPPQAEADAPEWLSSDEEAVEPEAQAKKPAKPKK